MSLKIWPFMALLLLAAPRPVGARSLEEKMEHSFSTFLRRDLTMENLRWRIFPIRFRAENLKLWEKSGLVMAEAPKATMTISMKTLFTGRVYVREMRFPKGRAVLRYTHDGKTNLADMVVDLSKFARDNRKPGQKQKVVYDIFRIENCSMDVVDADLNIKPLGAPFIVNAKGDINGLGPQTRFPFRLNAVLASSGTPAAVEVAGTISSRPQIHASLKNIPVSALAPYLPVVRWFEGGVNAEFDFSTGGAYKFWKWRVKTDSVRTREKRPFPVIKAVAFLHPFIPSTIDATLTGAPTELKVAMKLLGFRSKKVRLVVRSENAEIDEVIQWCRTGFLMAEAEPAAHDLRSEERNPPVWDVRGKADLKAELSSVIGPALVRKADGNVTLLIEEGRLVEMPGFVKALTKLNLASLLSKNDEKGLRFKTVWVNVDVNNGVARTREIIFLESPQLNLGVTGKVDFVKQTIDAQMLVGKGVIPLWVAIQGSLQNPNITLLPLSKYDRERWKSVPEKLRPPESEYKKIYR